MRWTLALATKFGCRVIGLGVPADLRSVQALDSLSREGAEHIRDEMQASIERAAVKFRAATSEIQAGVSWRSARAYPACEMLDLAGSADLIISDRGFGARGHPTSPVLKTLILESGRPVLVGPAADRDMQGETVVLAWSGARECRRAAHDALPFLCRAREVIVVQICDETVVGEVQVRLRELVNGLRLRGVSARAEARLYGEPSVAQEILSIADTCGADLIVMGAYGHGRIRRSFVGSNTDELLAHSDRFVLLSH